MFFCSFHKIDIFKQEFEKLFKVKNILVWVKNNHGMGDLKGDYASKTEFILLLQKGKPKIRGKRPNNVLEFARTGNVLHPTQKPVDLNEFMLKVFSDEGGGSFRPFYGFGFDRGRSRTAGAHVHRYRARPELLRDIVRKDIKCKRVNSHI